MYGPDMLGLCGNDDAGQMSAWYLFSSLGFYPSAPGSGWYDLGSPSVRSARLSVGDGNVLQIEAPGNAPDVTRVARVLWNGTPLESLRIQAQELLQGGTLTFEMM
jgi:putative alpha-1,2-mannosidase